MTFSEQQVQQVPPQPQYEYADNYPIDMNLGVVQQSKADAELTRWQLEDADVVNDVSMFFRGRQINERGVWEQVTEPLMNDFGVNQIVLYLRQLTSKCFKLSNYTHNEIMDEMKILDNEIQEKLLENWQMYGIKKNTDATTIKETILRHVRATMNRAEGAGERKYLGVVLRRVEQVTNQPTGRKTGSLFGG